MGIHDSECIFWLLLPWNSPGDLLLFRKYRYRTSTIPNALDGLIFNKATFAALSCAFATTLPMFQTPKGRTIRASLYGLLGQSAFIPAVHGVWINGWDLQNKRMGLSYFLGLGILNATGTVIYAARVPERWYPRRFDIWGSSHQIMHVLVMCGAVSHSIGLVQASQYWNGMRQAGGILCT